MDETDVELLMGDLDDFMPVTRKAFTVTLTRELEKLRSEMRDVSARVDLLSAEMDALKVSKEKPVETLKPSEEVNPPPKPGLLSYLFGGYSKPAPLPETKKIKEEKEEKEEDVLSSIVLDFEDLVPKSITSGSIRGNEEPIRGNEEPIRGNEEFIIDHNDGTGPHLYRQRENTDIVDRVPSLISLTPDAIEIGEIEEEKPILLNPTLVNIPYQGVKGITGTVNMVTITHCKDYIYIDGKVMFFAVKEDDELMHRIYIGLRKLKYMGDLEEYTIPGEIDASPLTRGENYFIVLGSDERVIKFSITLRKVEKRTSLGN